MLLHGFEGDSFRFLEKNGDLGCLDSALDLAERALFGFTYQRVLRWFRHVERMYEYRMVRRVLMANVS